MPAAGADAAAGGDAAGAAGGGDESPLLAVPPGSRDTPRLTPGSKGKAYTPVNPRKDGRKGAAVKSHNNSKWAKQVAGPSLRNIVPGAGEIQTLAKGIYEEEASIYSLREQTEEDKLFKINKSIKVLLENLEGKEKLITEQKNEDKAQ